MQRGSLVLNSLFYDLQPPLPWKNCWKSIATLFTWHSKYLPISEFTSWNTFLRTQGRIVLIPFVFPREYSSPMPTILTNLTVFRLRYHHNHRFIRPHSVTLNLVWVLEFGLDVLLNKSDLQPSRMSLNASFLSIDRSIW